MNEENGKKIWELLSELFREAAVLIWVFGLLLPHETLSLQIGIGRSIETMVLFIIGVWCESRMHKKGHLK